MNDFIWTAETRDLVRKRLDRFLDLWPDDKPCHIKVGRFVKSRTNKQNAALFGLAYKILRDETGHELKELHDFFCRRYFGEVTYEVLGEPRTKARRTTTTDENGKSNVMPWDEFGEFFEMVRTFAAQELCVNIPDPDPEYWRTAA